MAHRNCHGILVIPVSALFASVLENMKHYIVIEFCTIVYIIFFYFRNYNIKYNIFKFYTNESDILVWWLIIYLK
jgi:hypothetical protein